jgi:hypothetical protein
MDVVREDPEAQRRESERVRAENRERNEYSHAVGVLAEREQHRRQGNEAGVAACDEALRGLPDPTIDRPDPVQARSEREAAEREAKAKLSHARGVRSELAEAEASRNAKGIAECESSIRATLGLPADADVRDPALWPPEPVPPAPQKRRRRGRFGRKPGASGLVIVDPVKTAREDEREAEGLPRGWEPGYPNMNLPGRR